MNIMHKSSDLYRTENITAKSTTAISNFRKKKKPNNPI